MRWHPWLYPWGSLMIPLCLAVSSCSSVVGSQRELSPLPTWIRALLSHSLLFPFFCPQWNYHQRMLCSKWCHQWTLPQEPSAFYKRCLPVLCQSHLDSLTFLHSTIPIGIFLEQWLTWFLWHQGHGLNVGDSLTSRALPTYHNEIAITFLL